MDELNIKSETIDKAIDVISDSTKETRGTLDKRTAGGINKLFDLLWATPLGIKADVYIQSRPYKMEQEMEKMRAKYDKIPDKNKAEPSSYIALKGVQELTYCLDEEHLKELFSNLLIADMDNRKQSKVLPSYIEIIKQLSKEDAEFLKLLKNNDNRFYTINLKLKDKDSKGYDELDSFIMYDYIDDSNFSVSIINEVVTDNLQRLGIIEFSYDIWFTYLIEKYDQLFNAIKNNYTLSNNQTLEYNKGLIRPTALGKNFIDICLS